MPKQGGAYVQRRSGYIIPLLGSRTAICSVTLGSPNKVLQKPRSTHHSVFEDTGYSTWPVTALDCRSSTILCVFTGTSTIEWDGLFARLERRWCVGLLALAFGCALGSDSDSTKPARLPLFQVRIATTFVSLFGWQQTGLLIECYRRGSTAAIDLIWTRLCGVAMSTIV
jgi:hypothetical protein